jgi:hypothetical protein
MAEKFKAGYFYFPTSGTSHAVTGLGFQPQGIIFFGGNQSTEDAIVHTANPGLFFGMAWRDATSGSVDYQSISNAMMGVRWRPYPISCITSGTGIDYEASAVTFDSDGFTLTISNTASASRLVHYLAWGDHDGAAGTSIGHTASVGADYDYTGLGYRPLSALAFSMFSSGASRDGANGGAAYFTMGTNNFPFDDPESTSNGGAITFWGSTQTADGLTQSYLNFSQTFIQASVAGGLIGQWIGNIDHARPTPDWDSDGIRISLFGYPNRTQATWWSCEGQHIGVTSPDVGDVNSYTATAPRIPAVEAALFFGTTGYGDESQAKGQVNVAYMYGVLTKDYQGVVAWDTGLGPAPADDPHFFQSRQMCYAESMTNSGLRASSGEIFGNTVRLTGEIADTALPEKSGHMQVWAGVPEASWIPHIYRLVMPT